VSGRLIYGAIASLDGYVEDAGGHFDWAAPDEEVHAFVNDLERPVGTYLYGRRMYETMSAWETMQPENLVAQDFANIWRAADKIVYSTTLDAPTTEHTRLERDFDIEEVQRLKASAARDLSIGGAALGAHAIRAGLVDEYQLFIHPVVIGGGKHWLPTDVRLDLELVETRRFNSGVVYLHYRSR
jgi:dihydrofolate reductase